MDQKYPLTGPIPADGPRVVPAATIIIFRKGAQSGKPEFLLVQRAKEMRFAGGAVVFPGGRVDPSDRVIATQLAPDGDQEITSSKIAGIRETLEETGLLIGIEQSVNASQAAEARAMILETEDLAPVLKHFDWSIDLSALVFYAHWCPPFDKAFDTRFFVTDLGTGSVDITVDATENTKLFWATAEQALEMNTAGEITLIFPTLRNVERLDGFENFNDACKSAEEFPPRRMSAGRETIDGEDWITIPDGRGYPVLAQRWEVARRG